MSPTVRPFWTLLFFSIVTAAVGAKIAESDSSSLEAVYAWWCMFSETSRPGSTICKEWIHTHRVRPPQLYVEGHDSFEAVTETEEMYAGWCSEAARASRTPEACEHLLRAMHHRGDQESVHPTERKLNLPHCKMTVGGGEDEGEGSGVRLVMVVGIRGSGHHLVASILEKASEFVFVKKTAAIGIFSSFSPTEQTQQRVRRRRVLQDEGASLAHRKYGGRSRTSRGDRARNPIVAYPEKDPRVIASRIRNDPELGPVVRQAPFSTVNTIAFVADTFPEPSKSQRVEVGRRQQQGLASVSRSGGDLQNNLRDDDVPSGRSLLHPDLIAFSNLKHYGFRPILLFIRRHLALPALASAANLKRAQLGRNKRSNRPSQPHLKHQGSPQGQRRLRGEPWQSDHEHDQRPGGNIGGFTPAFRSTSRKGLGRNPFLEAELFRIEMMAVRIESYYNLLCATSRVSCYQVDYADLCSAHGKAYQELGWAFCIPKLSALTIYHRCSSHAAALAPVVAAPLTTSSAYSTTSNSFAALDRLPAASLVASPAAGHGDSYSKDDVALAKRFFEQKGSASDIADAAAALEYSKHHGDDDSDGSSSSSNNNDKRQPRATGGSAVTSSRSDASSSLLASSTARNQGKEGAPTGRHAWRHAARSDMYPHVGDPDAFL